MRNSRSGVATLWNHINLGQSTFLGWPLRKIDSEQVIIERCVDMLEPGGRFGLILPDGLFNNQGDRSNCPQTRTYLAKGGRILAIISLPDHAFRKSGAQNKTSILFFEKFNRAEKQRLERELGRLAGDVSTECDAIAQAIVQANLDYRVFLGEASHVGYTPVGANSPHNDLYRSGGNGVLAEDQTGTIMQEWRTFQSNSARYEGSDMPDCMAVPFSELWRAHASHRLDPKYHLFKREATRHIPDS